MARPARRRQTKEPETDGGPAPKLPRHLSNLLLLSEDRLPFRPIFTAGMWVSISVMSVTRPARIRSPHRPRYDWSRTSRRVLSCGPSDHASHGIGATVQPAIAGSCAIRYPRSNGQPFFLSSAPRRNQTNIQTSDATTYAKLSSS